MNKDIHTCADANYWISQSLSWVVYPVLEYGKIYTNNDLILG